MRPHQRDRSLVALDTLARAAAGTVLSCRCGFLLRLYFPVRLPGVEAVSLAGRVSRAGASTASRAVRGDARSLRSAGPAEVAPKREYIFKQVLRRAHRHGITLAPPPAHPFNPLLGLRIASLPMPEPDRVRVVDDLFDATWGDGPGITDGALVASRLDALGLDGAGLVARAGDPEAKARVRATTEAAIAAGGFGVPTGIVDGELFWGDDAHDDIDQFLRGDDAVDREQLARWATLPVGAQRRR